MASNYQDFYTQQFKPHPIPWFRDVQAAALTKFREHNFPSGRDERWRYFSPKILHELNIALPVSSPTPNFFAKNAGAINLVFLNGHFVKEHSDLGSLPKGLVIRAFPEIEQDATITATLRELTDQFANLDDDLFTHMNLAFCGQGVYIEVAEKTRIPMPIELQYFHTGALISSQPRVMIEIGERASVDILENSVSSLPTAYGVNRLTDIYLHPRGKLVYSVHQREGAEAVHLGRTRIVQKGRSTVNAFAFSMGAKASRNQIDIYLKGRKATTTLNGLYLAGTGQIVEHETNVFHMAPACVSDQLYKGIILSSGKGTFRGLVKVFKDAQQTQAKQLNKNLLLGDRAEVNTLPRLEIEADDVKCTHGATIGRFGEEELFYFLSRAISRKQAVNMLCQGFAADLLSRLVCPFSKSRVLQILESQIKHLNIEI